MPIPTMKLRLFRPIEKLSQDPDSGNYVWDNGEPVLQQLWERTEAEIEMIKRIKGIDVQKYEWRDVPIVLEERNNVQK